jgi:cytochrome b involved in lipid metabolism
VHLAKTSPYHNSFTITTTTMASNSKISVADKHAKPDDCWIVVNGKVYDLTTFAPNHPGGPDSEPFTTNTTTKPTDSVQ